MQVFLYRLVYGKSQDRVQQRVVQVWAGTRAAQDLSSAQDLLLRQAQFQCHTPAALSSRLFFLLFQPELCWCASSSMLRCAGVALANAEGEDGDWYWLILISSCLVWLQVPDRWEIAEEMGLGDTMGRYHLSVTVHPNVSYAVLMSSCAKELR